MKQSFKTTIIGLITGFANGLFGSGGGSVVVPAMEKYLDIKTHRAHASAIAVILPLCAVSMIFYLTKAKIDPMTVICVSAGGMSGGFIGAKLLKKLSSSWIHKIFGFCMIAAALRMIF